MKLIPKAKPVRIRISSGGVDHSTIESLKHNYDFYEVSRIPLESLRKWVSQQVKDSTTERIMDSLSSIDTQGDDYPLAVASMFFDENNIKSRPELMAYWDRKGFERNIMLYLNYLQEDSILRMCDNIWIDFPLVKRCLIFILKRNGQYSKAAQLGDAEAVELLRVKEENIQRQIIKEQSNTDSSHQVPVYTAKEMSILQNVGKQMNSVVGQMFSQKGRTNWDKEIFRLKEHPITHGWCPMSVQFIHDAYFRRYKCLLNIDQGIYPASWYNVLMKMKWCDWDSFLESMEFIKSQWHTEVLQKLRHS